MDRRLRLAAVVAACVSMLTLSAVAYALTTDMNDWNLTETTSSYGGGTQFHISTGTDGVASFRWLDSPNKTTVVSANSCTDLGVLGSPASIGVGDTGYHALFTGSQGACFLMRGRTGSGQGSMVNHDGRSQR